MRRIFFITGTDTGIGKTTLAVLLTRFLRGRGVNAAALKPVCSGDRNDARELLHAADGALELNEINPWHFRAPLAPVLSARREKKRLKLTDVLRHVKAIAQRFDVLLVEGAGGLLSPLGEDFNSLDLMVALRAIPLIVAPDRLGTVNHMLLTLAALPRNSRDQARVILMSPQKPDAATKLNAPLLKEFFDGRRIFSLPWLGAKPELNRRFHPDVLRVLVRLSEARL